jgi:hypothetical protein
MSAHVYRVVKGKDIVPRVPPATLSYRHLCEPVVIEGVGRIFMPTTTVSSDEDPAEQQDRSNEIKELVHHVPHEEQSGGADGSDNIKYERFIARFPSGLRDHMPESYLKPLFFAKGIRCGSCKAPPKATPAAPQKSLVAPSKKRNFFSRLRRRRQAEI